MDRLCEASWEEEAEGKDEAARANEETDHLQIGLEMPRKGEKSQKSSKQ